MSLRPKKFSSWVLPLLYARHCCKLSLHAIARKTNEPNLRKWQKTPSLGTDFGTFGADLAGNFFFLFFKNLASSVTKYHGKLSSCTITEKNNDPILRKLSDGE